MSETSNMGVSSDTRSSPDYTGISKILGDRSTPMGLKRDDFSISSSQENPEDPRVPRLRKQIADFLGDKQIGRYDEQGRFEPLDVDWVARQFVIRGRKFFELDLKRIGKGGYLDYVANMGEYKGVGKAVLLNNYLNLARRIAGDNESNS